MEEAGLGAFQLPFRDSLEFNTNIHDPRMTFNSLFGILSERLYDVGTATAFNSLFGILEDARAFLIEIKNTLSTPFSGFTADVHERRL